MRFYTLFQLFIDGIYTFSNSIVYGIEDEIVLGFPHGLPDRSFFLMITRQFLLYSMHDIQREFRKGGQYR